MFKQKSLFTNHIPPLAEQMRPQVLDDMLGQEHLLGNGQLFRQAIETDTFGSCIFWGPPGSGKTTLASLIAKITNRPFVAFNAAFNGIKEVKEIVEAAKKRIDGGGKNTVLFVDEIHRFNKAQQDAFLHPLEQGTIILIGATTENPSFEINAALLSRCSVYILKQLEDEHVESIVTRVLSSDTIKAKKLVITEDAKNLIVNYANGDARAAINVLELAASASKLNAENKRILSIDIVKQAMNSRRIGYDKRGEEFYNLISALHKSMRGSDAQAALYWLARMIEGGADPLYIVRRLIRFASEDIGLADPQALVQAIATKEAIDFLGFPECDVILAQCVIYLSTAPKSNKSYVAICRAKHDVREKPNEPVPLHIRNAPTKLMKHVGYGKGYQYDHEEMDSFSGQRHLPNSMGNPTYYEPGEYGFEREIKKRLDYWADLKKKKVNQ
jgi:putative ATPase